MPIENFTLLKNTQVRNLTLQKLQKMEKEFALKNQNERMHTQAMLDEII